jgi:hypothetical protein
MKTTIIYNITIFIIKIASCTNSNAMVNQCQLMLLKMLVKVIMMMFHFMTVMMIYFRTNSNNNNNIYICKNILTQKTINLIVFIKYVFYTTTC